MTLEIPAAMTEELEAECNLMQELAKSINRQMDDQFFKAARLQQEILWKSLIEENLEEDIIFEARLNSRILDFIEDEDQRRYIKLIIGA